MCVCAFEIEFKGYLVYQHFKLKACLVFRHVLVSVPDSETCGFIQSLPFSKNIMSTYSQRILFVYAEVPCTMSISVNHGWIHTHNVYHFYIYIKSNFGVWPYH
jgi:hypothetical protein